MLVTDFDSIIQAYTAYGLSVEELLVNVSPRKMNLYPEFGGGRVARKGSNLFTWRKPQRSASAPSLSRLHNHTRVHNNW
jgi:hypothetical protein